MKKILCLLLVVAVVMSVAAPVIAEKSENGVYYSVFVEYSDKVGQQELLNLMVQDKHVYVDAEMLSERLGFSFVGNKDRAIIYKALDDPYWSDFSNNSTQVNHLLFGNTALYEAPFPIIINERGTWVPFEFLLYLLGTDRFEIDDTLLIDIPTENIIDTLYKIRRSESEFIFNWSDDFGYSDSALEALGRTYHYINVMNGLLEFDGASWLTLFQQLTVGSTASYDRKYGEQISLLICTESEKELRAEVDNVNELMSLLDANGKLGELLREKSLQLDMETGRLIDHCDEILKEVYAGSKPVECYNKSYQAFEKAYDKEKWFDHTWGNVADAQDWITNNINYNIITAGKMMLEAASYMDEFQNQDEFSVAAINEYLVDANGASLLPSEMRESMQKNVDRLSGDISCYSAFWFLKNNIGNWIKDGIPFTKGTSIGEEILGAQASGILFAWDLASSFIPFVANGLSAADQFEMSQYASLLQYYSMMDFNNVSNIDFSNTSPELLYRIVQYCYVALKACYITREAAVATLVNTTNSVKEKIQPLIKHQNDINTEIAYLLTKLKNANKTNKGFVFGFLPSDNVDYLKTYSDADIIEWILENHCDGIFEEEDSIAAEPEIEVVNNTQIFDDKVETINRLNALLIGVDYTLGDVSRWVDYDVYYTIRSKLLLDNFEYSDSSYLKDVGLGYWVDDDWDQHFNLDVVQRITHDTLGMDFPSGIPFADAYISGNELVFFNIADGESNFLVVQNYNKYGDKTVAVGIAIHKNNIDQEFRGYFQAVFQENPSSVYGYTLLSIDSLEENQDFAGLKASASSELVEGTGVHSANNVLDGDLNTAWVEGVDGVGNNEWIMLETTDGSKMDISALEFAMGYQKSYELFEKNGWPSEILIECEGGYQQRIEFIEEILTDLITMDHSIHTSWIKITILNAVPGSKYNDTCISEIRVFGVNEKAFFDSYIDNGNVAQGNGSKPTPIKITVDSLFSQIAGEYEFSSGAGAWETTFQLSETGAFQGRYFDYDVEDVYNCEFDGKFSNVERISDTVFSVQMMELNEYKNEGGFDVMEDGILYHYLPGHAYGLVDGEQFLIYLPGTPTTLINREALLYNNIHYEYESSVPDGTYIIYNINTDRLFTNRKTITES